MKSIGEFIMVLRNLFVLLMLAHDSLSAPKTLICKSYDKDNEQIDYEDEYDNYDEYDASLPDYKNWVPQHRVCQHEDAFCFSVWRQFDNGTSRIEGQGCWRETADRHPYCNQTECTSSMMLMNLPSLYFCCCSADSCNDNMRVVEMPAEESNRNENSNWLPQPLAFWCCVLIVGIVISIILAALYRRRAYNKSDRIIIRGNSEYDGSHFTFDECPVQELPAAKLENKIAK